MGGSRWLWRSACCKLRGASRCPLHAARWLHAKVSTPNTSVSTPSTLGVALPVARGTLAARHAMPCRARPRTDTSGSGGATKRRSNGCRGSSARHFRPPPRSRRRIRWMGWDRSAHACAIPWRREGCSASRGRAVACDIPHPCAQHAARDRAEPVQARKPAATAQPVRHWFEARE